MKKRKVFITGSNGFLGRYITRYAIRHNFEVTGTGNHSYENAFQIGMKAYFKLELPNPQLEEILCSLKPDICIHCAGRASVPLSIQDPAVDFHSSVDVTFQILETLRRNAPKCKLIFLSSAAVYGNPIRLPVDEFHPCNPISPYGFHKLISEQLCREYSEIFGLPTIVTRIFSAYGPGLRRQVLWDICCKALTSSKLNLHGTGEEGRDFIHTRDIAEAMFVLADKAPAKGEVYNLASGNETSIRVLTEKLLQHLGVDIPVRFDGRNPVGMPLNWRADTSRIQALGFKPAIDLDEGLAAFSRWVRTEV